MTYDPCRDELVLAQRRWQLSEPDRLTLEEHLKSCQSCRTALEFGKAFDESSAIRSDDSQRLERMMSAAERWLERPRPLAQSKPLSRRRTTIVTAVAIAAFTTAAAAAVAIRSQVLETRKLSLLDSTTSASEAVVTVQAGGQNPLRQHVPRPSSAPPVEGEKDARATPDARATLASFPVAAKDIDSPLRLPSSTPLRSTARHDASSITAEQLLVQANAARRDGHLDEASRAFRRLQRLFPTSRESDLSLVAFGSLLLEQKNGAAALDQFNRYLARGSQQILTAEALYGKARSLSTMGRSVEERATWRQLLSQFPTSPYSEQARKRLDLSR